MAQRPEPALAVAAVARRLGVAPATLRTWDRRYGLGPSEHSAGSHRRYTAADVERLLIMRRLTLDGVAPAEAARIALASADGAIAESAPGGSPGWVSPTTLVDAALAGDAATCARGLVLDAGSGVVEVTRWWTELLEPALAALARRTVVERPGRDAAATLLDAARAALRARTALPPVAAPVVLVLGAPARTRPLVLHALAAALSVEGVDARVVGGPVGPHHVVELVTMTRPRAVVTHAERGGADLAVIERLAHERPDVAQFVVLPEESARALPLGPPVHLARSFAGLVHEVLAVASGLDRLGPSTGSDTAHA